MCSDCAYWIRLGTDRWGDDWGDCVCPSNQFEFVPHAWCPESFRKKGGTLEEWYKTHKPNPVPLTRSGHDCKYRSLRV